jgi:DNA-binding response OmpR family regulator
MAHMAQVANSESERTVVIVEDDPNIADLVDLYLREAGFRVLQGPTGERGLELIAQHRPVLAVLDVGLPDIDGFEVCRRIRNQGRPQAAGAVPHRPRRRDRPGARPRARRRRLRHQALLAPRARGPGEGDPAPGRAAGAPAAEQTTFDVGDGIVVDVARREVRNAGGPVALATKEFDLLAHLARNQGIALSRQQLIDGVWGADWYGDDRTVDVHVRQLRKKVGDELPLATVWGVGTVWGCRIIPTRLV